MSLARVRESCAKLQTSLVSIDDTASESFLSSLSVEEVKTYSEKGCIQFDDLIFSSVLSEAAFITLTHALDFGSGFRKELHEHCGGRGAWLTIKPGCEAIYKSNSGLEAQTFQDLSLDDVHKLFNFPKIGDLCLLGQHILDVLQEIGTKLKELGHRSLLDFVDAALSLPDSGASTFVEQLVITFPLTFDDCYDFVEETGGSPQKVYLYKKAQLVTGELYHRFRSEDARFKFSDAASLTAFVDNVIVACLRKIGVLKCSREIEERIESGEQLGRGSGGEVALRARACEAINAMARRQTELTAVEIGNFLWGVLGKTPAFRSFPRHSTKDTVFY